MLKRFRGRIGVAAYNGNHLAKALLARLRWSKQAWHITFGHVGELNRGLPETQSTQFVVAQCQNVGVLSYWSTCPCGITEHVYQAMEVDRSDA